MESVDVGTLHADRLKNKRLDWDLYYSKEPLAELTHERASKVSLELLDELNDYKESTNVAQQFGASDRRINRNSANLALSAIGSD